MRHRTQECPCLEASALADASGDEAEVAFQTKRSSHASEKTFFISIIKCWTLDMHGGLHCEIRIKAEIGNHQRFALQV